jgi:hypothetical protein
MALVLGTNQGPFRAVVCGAVVALGAFIRELAEERKRGEPGPVSCQRAVPVREVLS